MNPAIADGQLIKSKWITEDNPMGNALFGVVLPDRWVLSEWDNQVKRMMELYRSPPNALDWQRCIVTVTLVETKLKGTNDMRLVFNTSVTVDVSANDDELRRAFIELVCMKAREVYGPAAMLAKSKPIMKITETSRDGMVEVDMFTSDVRVGEGVE